MDVPSKCTIARTMARSACGLEVSSGRNQGQNRGKFMFSAFCFLTPALTI
jgi:hypothetical protein